MLGYSYLADCSIGALHYLAGPDTAGYNLPGQLVNQAILGIVKHQSCFLYLPLSSTIVTRSEHLCRGIISGAGYLVSCQCGCGSIR